MNSHILAQHSLAQTHLLKMVQQQNTRSDSKNYAAPGTMAVQENLTSKKESACANLAAARKCMCAQHEQKEQKKSHTKAT